ncbi:hypothetical protein [Aurantiacibacter sp. D1-12]|uniref:hypothetical protein n=1 Tax=Aurantiacibacter sp. D1-12 TaxID=2993658 RepID=UPI00237CFEC6|nr:hypothetical protein [Aurantiacibacter sp. D1-12]MDE1466544.1 hypothetical protein [Aurantiacibacter sp. D1-12]
MRISESLVAIVALALAGCVSNTPNDLANIQPTEELMAAIYSPARPAEDVARDDARLPLETLTFAGVRRGQVIAQIASADGYYTRILSQAVGAEGRLYVLLDDDMDNAADAFANLEAIAGQYGNVEIIYVDSMAGNNVPEPVDIFWAAEFFPALTIGDGSRAAAALASLKPGGALYIEDTITGNLGAARDIPGMRPRSFVPGLVAVGFEEPVRSNHLVGVYSGEGTGEAFLFRRPG